MNVSSRELLEVLATFTTQDCARAVALARRLVVMDGVSLSKNESGVPTGDLKEVYSDYASSSSLPKGRIRECEDIVRLTTHYPFERWYIISVDIGFYSVVIFANEQGVGRYCFAYTHHEIIVAIQLSWNISSIARYLYDEYRQPDDVKLVEGALIVSTSEGGALRIEELPEKDLATNRNYRDEYRSNPTLPEEFRRDVGQLRLFRIIFNDIEPVRRLLRRLTQDMVKIHERAWIDTIYQSVISARDFLAKTDAEPDWDWITYPSSA